MSAWRDWIPPDEVSYLDRPEPKPDVPRAVGIFFGAQVGWDPDREGGKKIAAEWACDLVTHQVLIVELCPTCLSGFGDIHLGHRVVCASCLRYSEDPRIQALLRAEAESAQQNK